MELLDTYLVTFSPTHTSKRVGEKIVHGFGGEKYHLVNLTHADQCAELVIPKTALTVFTLPVYGGHVPELALERMTRLTSQGGGPAVVVVLYGNRAYEKALEELDDVVAQKGFKVIGGGTFIGEHSYSSKQYPIAAGRPDADDLEYARLFGEKLRTKVAMASDEEHLYAVDVRKIVRPRQPLWPLLRFVYQVYKFRKSGIGLPRTPQTDALLCTQCGSCVKVCPTGAILSGKEWETSADACIRCCACVKACAQHARTYDTPFSSMLSSCFTREKENRIIL